jgi:pSer/pThr/pTyr-binding forkhead associated (FHA) protein
MTEKDSSKRIRLTVQGGPTREFPGDRTFVIGRSQNADFSIPHPNLSREHVRISLKAGEVWMEDLGSANGTFVQGQRVPAKSLVKIKPHYRILLGTGSNVLISLEAIDESESMAEYADSTQSRDVDPAAAREVTRNVNAPVGAGVRQAPIAPDYTAGSSTVGSQKPNRELELTASRAVSIALERPAPIEPTRSETSNRYERTEPRENPIRTERVEGTRTGITRSKSRAPGAPGGSGYELDFPQQHFPQEAKKEKLAELRIIEAKKQRVIEDIQYKEREVDDLRSKIRVLREDAVKLKEQTDAYKRELAPMEQRRQELESVVSELEQVYEEKIDALESGFADLKATLEESHSVRMARADKDHKEKMRRLDEEYSRKLHELEAGTKALHAEGVALRERLTDEKRHLEETLKKVREEKEAIEAERNLAKVRIDTEMAQMQGAKLKLENEHEGLRRDRERIANEVRGIHERVKQERVKLEDAKKSLASTTGDRDSLLRSIEEIKINEAQNLKRIDEMRATVAQLEGRSKALEATIRQAEHDAETIRRRAKEEADQYRQAMQDQADAERALARKNAETQAAQIVSNAESEATTRIKAAEVQSAARLQAAEAQASARVQADVDEQKTRIAADDS